MPSHTHAHYHHTNTRSRRSLRVTNKTPAVPYTYSHCHTHMLGSDAELSFSFSSTCSAMLLKSSMKSRSVTLLTLSMNLLPALSVDQQARTHARTHEHRIHTHNRKVEGPACVVANVSGCVRSELHHRFQVDDLPEERPCGMRPALLLMEESV